MHVLTIHQSFSPTSEQKEARERAFHRLQKTIHGLGEGYDLIDISVESIKGRQPAWNSPLECYISVLEQALANSSLVLIFDPRMTPIQRAFRVLTETRPYQWYMMLRKFVEHAGTIDSSFLPAPWHSDSS